MANYLNYPFDPELFNYNWGQIEDTTLTAMIDSGAVVRDGSIQSLISTGSDTYTVPFYKVLDGSEVNYDGATDITSTEQAGGSQSGIVYGRAAGFGERDFTVDYNSGADPMKQITSQVAKFWQKSRQNKLIGIMGGIFGITNTEWANHTTDISSASATVTDDNRMGASTVNDAITKALGDNRAAFQMAIMHSMVASKLEALGLLQFRKYTDPQGIERTMNIADINGLTVIVDDSAPYTAGTTDKAGAYTTYLLGSGVIRYAEAPVSVPSEVDREASVNGGMNKLYTRVRETIHPNGFTFSKPSSGYTASPTDAQLFATANWSIADGSNLKAVPMARIISNI
jgi:hypothetical protein